MLLVVDKPMVNNFREVENTKIYNINTLHEGFIDASILFNIMNTKEFFNIHQNELNTIAVQGDNSLYLTSNENFNINEVKDFDILYKNIIFNNDAYFKVLFNIIYDLYININVVLAVDLRSESSEFIIESLTKLIQQVYEYSSVYIYNEDDIDNIKYSEAEFGITGLYNLDIDKKRFLNLLTKEELERLENESSK